MTNKSIQDKDEEKYFNYFSSVIFFTLYPPKQKVNFTSEIENMFNMQEVYLSYCMNCILVLF